MASDRASLSECRVTHGRHCPCSACKQEDWPSITGPCGMHGADCPAVYAPFKEPTDMGVWCDDGEVVWLPRSLYPKRFDAIKWAMNEWGCSLPEVRCRSRWMRYVPNVGRKLDGSLAYIEDYWHECQPTEYGAFRVWRLDA